MPGDSEHPVTLGDLRVSESMGFGSHKKWSTRPATIADLVSVLRAEGVDFIEQWEYNHAEHCRNQYPHPGICTWPLPDALRESELLVTPGDNTEAQGESDGT